MESAAQFVTCQDLSVIQKRYAVIEKEGLATTWASERFSDYVLGIPFTLDMQQENLKLPQTNSHLLLLAYQR